MLAEDDRLLSALDRWLEISGRELLCYCKNSYEHRLAEEQRTILCLFCIAYGPVRTTRPAPVSRAVQPAPPSKPSTPDAYYYIRAVSVRSGWKNRAHIVAFNEGTGKAAVLCGNRSLKKRSRWAFTSMAGNVLCETCARNAARWGHEAKEKER